MKNRLIAGLIMFLGIATAAGLFLFTNREAAAFHTCPEGQIAIHNPVTGSPECIGGPTATSSTITTDQATSLPEGENFGCSLLGGWDGLKGCGAAMAFWVMNLFGVFLGIAGVLLNGAVEITVQKMSVFVTSIPAIESTWTLIRDLGNIVILFVLLFSAIGTIFRTDKIVPKNALVGVIIAAVLINFSLFFTKAIIDVSNIATNTIYNEIKQISLVNNEGSNNPIQLMGISGAFMQGLNPQTIYSQIQKSGEGSEDYESHIFQQMIFGIIVILIAAFVLLIAALMLFIRFGILIMLLITSPIGVVGNLIPKLSGYSKQWWETLMGQAIFAPVLMLFMLITISIINSPGFKTSVNLANQDIGADSAVGKFFAFFGAGTGQISLAIQYFLVIFFLIFTVIIAKNLAGGFGKGAVKWASGKAGSLAFGGGAALSQRTLGRFGANLSDSRFAKDLAASNNIFARGLGQGLIGGGDRLKKASFDLRNTYVGSELGAGKGTKGGYDKWLDEQKKAREKQASRFGAESRETARALRETSRAEQRTKEDLRRIPVGDSRRIDAEFAAQEATKAREAAENRAKIEREQDRERMGQRERQTFRTARGLNRFGSLWTTLVNPADREAAKTLEEKAHKELLKLNLSGNSKRLAEAEARMRQYQQQAKSHGLLTKEPGPNGNVEEAEIQWGTVTNPFRSEYERLHKEVGVLRESVNTAKKEKEKKDRVNELKEAQKAAQKELDEEGGGKKVEEKKKEEGGGDEKKTA